MRSQAFYTTAAQVLPALVIALAVEFGFMLNAILKEYEQRLDEAQQRPRVRSPAESPDPFSRFRQRHAEMMVDRVTSTLRFVAWLGFTAAVAFLLGELSSLIVVFVGTDGWFPWIAAPLTWLALVVCMLVVVATPLVRLHWWAIRSSLTAFPETRQPHHGE